MGLIAHYKLDGNANDALGKYNGTASNVTWVDGKLGQAGSFNGSNAHVTLPRNQYSMPVSSFSLAFWVNGSSDSATGPRYVFLSGRDMNNSGIGIDRDGVSTTYRFFAWIAGSIRSLSFSIANDSWSHVVCSYDANVGAKVFVNGVMVASHSYTGSIAYTEMHGSSPSIGSHGGIYFYNGLIDDVRIYDHALSEREVRDLSQGLVLHYTFDQFQEPTENVLSVAGYESESVKSGTSYPFTAHNITTVVQSRWSVTNNKISLQMESRNDVGDGYASMYIFFSDWSWSANFGTNDTSWALRELENIEMPNPAGKTVIFSVYHMHAGSTGTSYVRKLQFEFKTHCTPFVNGTRTGIVRDQSTQGNDAPLALANTPKWVEGGMVGKGCYEFSGDGKTPGILSPQIKTDKYTIAFWAKHTSTDKMVFGSGRNAAFYWYGDNSWKYTHGGTSGEFYYPKSQTINIGEWGHFAVTYDGSNIRIYRNSVFEGIKASSGIPNFDRHSIGWGYSYQSYDFQGQLDDVRIYTTALSADEVKELYHQRVSLDSRGDFYSNLISSSVGYQKVWGDGSGVGFTTYGIDESSVSTNGVLRFTTSTGDPMINMYNIGSFDPKVYKFIQVKYRVVSGNAGNVEIFFCNTQYTVATGAQHRSAPLNSDGNWNVVTVAMHTHPNWTNSNITGWRFDMGTASGVTTEVEWIRLVSDTGALSVKSNKVVGNFSEVGITNGLVAYYPLNKDAKDYSGNGNHGIVTGAVLTGGGFDGKGAYRFDGYPNSITGLGQYTALTKFTYSAWVNRSVNQDNFLILGARQGNNTYISMAVIGNRVCLHKYGFNSNLDINVATGNTLINTGVWRHIVITYDEGVTKTFVDGALDGSGFHINTSYSAIGMQINYEDGVSDTHKNFKGDISNVKIFNRALTPEEIAVEYKRTGVSKMTQHNGTVYIQGQVKETI